VTALRSGGWSVQPSFSPSGPTEPVTLLLDDQGLTQLAGEPVVAWQTPWSEVTHLRVIRQRRGAVMFAVIAHVAYQWRHRGAVPREEFDQLRAYAVAHGGHVVPTPRRRAAAAVAAAVTVASLGGYVGSLLAPQTTSSVVTALEQVNLSSRDVSGTWASTSQPNGSLLSALLLTPGQVANNNPATTTTSPALDSPLGLAANHFQRCLGVASVDDRVFGAAGTTPRYEVSSPVFYSSDFGGVQVASTAQYYDDPQSVALDVIEMSRPNFGRCLAQSLGDALIGSTSSATPNLATGTNLTATTFVKGWVRAGQVALTLPTVTNARAHFVVVVAASGHYEVTMLALVVNLAAARTTLDSLVNNLALKISSTSSVAA